MRVKAVLIAVALTCIAAFLAAGYNTANHVDIANGAVLRSKEVFGFSLFRVEACPSLASIAGETTRPPQRRIGNRYFPVQRMYACGQWGLVGSHINWMVSVWEWTDTPVVLQKAQAREALAILRQDDPNRAAKHLEATIDKLIKEFEARKNGP